MGGPDDVRRPVMLTRLTRLTVFPRIPLGGGPLQLLLLVCSFALAAYAGVRLLADDWSGVALWFVGAALLHDLVLLPLYAIADRAVVRGLGAVRRREWAPSAAGEVRASRHRSHDARLVQGDLPVLALHQEQ
ncbi:hypothetical protein ACWEQU_16905, partial [Streptomyces nodosus]